MRTSLLLRVDFRNDRHVHLSVFQGGQMAAERGDRGKAGTLVLDAWAFDELAGMLRMLGGLKGERALAADELSRAIDIQVPA